MSSKDPTPNFRSAVLDYERITAGEVYYRIFANKYPNPLGYGKTKSRFSDPIRRAEASRFGVLYLGSTIDVCFLEAILRDNRNGSISSYPLSEAWLRSFNLARIEVRATLDLIQLDGNGPVRMGIPTDVAKASNQALSRRWSRSFFEHPDLVDGVHYPSRLNGAMNLAIYDRAVLKLAGVQTIPLMTEPEMARILDEFKIASVP